MFDYISLNIDYLSRSAIERMPGIQLVREGYKKGVYPFWEYEYFNFKVYYSNVRKTLSGSIHHFHNALNGEGAHNSNDLYFHELMTTLGRLMADFQLTKGTRVRVLEYGVNIVVPFAPKEFIRTNLVGWDKKCGTAKDYKNRGQECHFIAASDRILKVYDKGLHQEEYTNGQSILRIETRYNSNRAIQEALGFDKGYEVTLSDISTTEGCKRLNKRLYDAVIKLMIVDSTTPAMPLKDLLFFKDCLSPIHWTKLKDEKRYMQRTRNFLRFNALCMKYQIDTIKREIIDKVQNKLIDLHLCEFSHSVKKGQNVRKPTIDKSSISNTPKLRPIKCHHYEESHPDHPDNKRIRNSESNFRNNTARRLLSSVNELENTLFEDPSEVITLSEDHVQALKVWRGTKHDVLGRLGM